MLTLAFDTTMARCGVAIGSENDPVIWRNETMARGQAEALLPRIKDFVAKANVDLKDIEGLCVTTGPGTFTGVRIGIAAAKGLALAFDIPIFACSTLQAVAFQAGQALRNGQSKEFFIAQDARRGEVYIQRFKQGPDGPPASIGDPAALPLLEARAMVQGCWVAGTGARFIADSVNTILPCDHEVDVRTVLQLARFCSPTDYKALRPLYLRAPDAKLPQKTPINALRQKMDP